VKPGPSALDQFVKTTEPLRKKAARAGRDAFLAFLPEEEIPGERDALAAAGRAENRALEVVSPGFARALGLEDGGKAALFALKLQEHLPPLPASAPAVERSTPPLRTGLAAAAGALIGMGLISPLTALFFGSREAGFLLGAPLGAFAMSMAALRLPENRKLLWALAAILGLASLREVFAFLGSASLFSLGWNLLRKKRGSFSCLVLFPALLALVLLLGRRTERLDRKTWADTVEAALSAWLEGAARTAFLLAAEGISPEAAPSERDVTELAGKIFALQGASCDELSAGMDELAEEIRGLGFGSAADEGEFEWNPAAGDRYDLFGLAEPGDRVRVERPPLLRDGHLLRRGLARKVRRP
jgi:hypothetical protein